MSGDREATSDHSFLVHLDMSNDEVCLSSYDPMTGYQTGSKEKEPLAHFSKEEEREEEEEEKEKEEGVEGGGGRKIEEGRRREEVEAPSSSCGNYRPFILPIIWSVNNFLSKMSNKVFSRLCPHFQIHDNIHLKMARKRERYYSRWTADVGFYEAIFLAGLRLALIELHHWLADHLGMSVHQIYPNV